LYSLANLIEHEDACAKHQMFKKHFVHTAHFIIDINDSKYRDKSEAMPFVAYQAL
jgi:hypothetical protein